MSKEFRIKCNIHITTLVFISRTVAPGTTTASLASTWSSAPTTISRTSTSGCSEEWAAEGTGILFRLKYNSFIRDCQNFEKSVHSMTKSLLNVTIFAHDQLRSYLKKNSPSFRIEAKKKKQLKKEVDQLFMFLERSWPEQKSDSANRELTTKKPNVIPTAPPMPSNLHVLCPLDIRLDTVTR